MKDKRFFKNPEDLKTEIEELFSFQEKEDPPEPPRKAEDGNPDNPGAPSKYRKILSCSFVNDTRTAASAERIEAQKCRFP